MCAVFPAALCLAQPAFEAASIKPSAATDNGSSWRMQPGRLTMVNESIRQIIQAAYTVQDYQYSGPGWLENERYDINATTDIRGDGRQMLLMLQRLLTEQLLQVFLEESRELGVFVLDGRRVVYGRKANEPTKQHPGEIFCHNGAPAVVGDCGHFTGQELS